MNVNCTCEKRFKRRRMHPWIQYKKHICWSYIVISIKHMTNQIHEYVIACIYQAELPCYVWLHALYPMGPPSNVLKIYGAIVACLDPCIVPLCVDHKMYWRSMEPTCYVWLHALYPYRVTTFLVFLLLVLYVLQLVFRKC